MRLRTGGLCAAALVATIVLPADEALPGAAPPAPPFQLWNRGYVWHTETSAPGVNFRDVNFIQNLVSDPAFVQAELGGGTGSAESKGRKLSGIFTTFQGNFAFHVTLDHNTYDVFTGKVVSLDTHKSYAFSGAYERIAGNEVGRSVVNLKLSASTKKVVRLPATITFAAAVQNEGPALLGAHAAELVLEFDEDSARNVQVPFIHPGSRTFWKERTNTVDNQRWTMVVPLGALGARGDRAVFGATVKIGDEFLGALFHVVARVRTVAGFSPSYQVLDAKDGGEDASVELVVPILE